MSVVFFTTCRSYKPRTSAPTRAIIPTMKEHKLILLIYVLLACFIFWLLLPVLGLLIAYFIADGKTAADASHLRYQKRTFWIAVLLKVCGLVVTGIVLLAAGAVDAIARAREEGILFGPWDGSYHMMYRFHGRGWDIWDSFVQNLGPGLVYSFVVLFVLYFISIGIWFFGRCIKGFLRARKKQAINNPATWWI